MFDKSRVQYCQELGIGSGTGQATEFAIKKVPACRINDSLFYVHKAHLSLILQERHQGLHIIPVISSLKAGSMPVTNCLPLQESSSSRI